jgi:hypothetical protein
MSDVYQNALCNLSATGAADSMGGLFFDRDLSEVLPCKVEISWAGFEKEQAFAVDSYMYILFSITRDNASSNDTLLKAL